MKLCIIGAGVHAQNLLRRGVFPRDEVEIVAVATRHDETAQAVALEFDLPHFFGSAEKLFRALEAKTVEADAVYIATPHESHAALAIRALEAGLHVLVEKPMAATSSEAWKMCAVAKSCGRTLAVDYQYRFAIEAVLEVVRSGALGTLLKVEGWWTRRYGIPDRPSFFESEAAGVGPDLLGHLLSAALPLIVQNQNPKWVLAVGSNAHGVARFGPEFRAWDSLFTILGFDPSGLLATFKTSWATNTEVDESLGLRLEGSAASLVVPLPSGGSEGEHLTPVLYERVGGAGGERVDPRPLPGLPTKIECIAAVVRNWIRACRGVERLYSAPEDAAAIQRILEITKRSTDSPVRRRRAI